MADGVVDTVAQEAKEGAKAFRETMGSGGTWGIAIGGALGLVAALSSPKMPSWLKWLLTPLTAFVGLLIGDGIKKDGYVFGPNGVINALKNHNKPKTIPEGYTALSPHAGVTALDSEVLAKNGDVHYSGGAKTPDEVLLGFKELRELDPFVEYNISGDPRLEELKVKARGYAQKYGDPKSPDYIANVQSREQTIAHLVVDDIGEVYGIYNPEIYDYKTEKFIGTLNDAEKKTYYSLAALIGGGKTLQLKDIKKNGMVCRHYAPVVSVLLHEAGVPNYVMSSDVGVVKRKEPTSPELCLNINNDITGMGHMYVITKQGNAVVEGVVAGNKDPDQMKRRYMPVLNGVTAEDIALRQRAAIVDVPRNAKRRYIYGGGFDGTNKKTDKPDYVIKQVMQTEIDKFNEQLRLEKAKQETVAMQESTKYNTDRSSMLPLDPTLPTRITDKPMGLH